MSKTTSEEAEPSSSMLPLMDMVAAAEAKLFGVKELNECAEVFTLAFRCAACLTFVLLVDEFDLISDEEALLFKLFKSSSRVSIVLTLWLAFDEVAPVCLPRKWLILLLDLNEGLPVIMQIDFADWPL